MHVFAWQSSSPQAGCSGPVMETMNSGGYTYVKVDCDGEEVWAAGPQTSLAVGDEVILPAGAPMNDFHSATLNRTFETIFFVSHLQVPGKENASDSVRDQIAQAHQKAGVQAGATELDFSGIQKPEGGKTIAEIFAEKSDLSGKEVIVRGKVVKFNAKILGTNWIHLRDGTGAAGTNDLTVTTTGTAEVGDTVLIKGEVTLDKDFGFGYEYDVIIENAVVTVE